ncbi:aldo/keto reductase [Actinacidiphila sp. ITFR-21]|uniref:aldo/keto reductase n=1 Tax=Actinacidiphila sp. ITFR-21 TaxID=3075199 RepID=UPI00288B18B6|nr:aldo/keto reductase [Streptomyces sp. ITFR-21]WNI16514.1 aldo/keto reductase [Streptomyces sp. ITFR-21]
MARIGNSELDVHPLSLGGNVFGWTADEEHSFAVLDAYAAAGGNFVDSADRYADGQSETIIGRWLDSRGRRDDFVVATKVGAGTKFPGLKPDTIRAAAEASLRRLGADRIDLYYTHVDDPEVPVEEIITALDGLVKAGKVRAIGASNISPERLAASLDFSEREGLARYEILQPHYSLVERAEYEGPLLDLVAARGLSAAPYFALAAGFLTGKYRPDAEAVVSVRASRAAAYLEQERGPKVLAALDEVAAAHGVEPASVALAWLAAQPTVVAPIASARTVEQLPALLAFVDLKLTGEEIAALTAASA